MRDACYSASRCRMLPSGERPHPPLARHLSHLVRGDTKLERGACDRGARAIQLKGKAIRAASIISCYIASRKSIQQKVGASVSPRPPLQGRGRGEVAAPRGHIPKRNTLFRRRCTHHTGQSPSDTLPPGERPHPPLARHLPLKGKAMRIASIVSCCIASRKSIQQKAALQLRLALPFRGGAGVRSLLPAATYRCVIPFSGGATPIMQGNSHLMCGRRGNDLIRRWRGTFP